MTTGLIVLSTPTIISSKFSAPPSEPVIIVIAFCMFWFIIALKSDSSALSAASSNVHARVDDVAVRIAREHVELDVVGVNDAVFTEILRDLAVPGRPDNS